MAFWNLAGKTIFGAGKLALGMSKTTGGRIAGAGILGGSINAMMGDPNMNIGDRFVFGAMQGAVVGAGFEFFTSRAGLRMTGRAGITGAKGVTRRISAPFRAGYAEGGVLGALDFGTAAAIKGVSLTGKAGLGLGIAGAVVGGIGYAGYQGAEMRRTARVARFQQSTHGLVQGMHAGRHRG